MAQQMKFDEKLCFVPRRYSSILFLPRLMWTEPLFGQFHQRSSKKTFLREYTPRDAQCVRLSVIDTAGRVASSKRLR